MYLVLLRHTMDDLPVRLFARRDLAMEYVKGMDGMPSDYERSLFRTDCETPVSVYLVTFENGLPVAAQMVRDFTKEKVCHST